MTTIPISPSSSITSIARAWAPAMLAACAAVPLHAGCAADEEPRAVARQQNAEIAPAPTAGASEADVAAVRAARGRIWDQLAAGLPDGYLLSVEMFAPPSQPAFAVVTRVKDHHAVQNVVGVPPSAARTAAAASGEPAAPEIIAMGSPPPKEPSEPGVAALGNTLMTAAFHDNAQALTRMSPQPSRFAVGDPEDQPLPGFPGEQGDAQDRSRSSIVIGYPPAKEDPHPGSAPGAGGAQGAAQSDLTLGYPPSKEKPQPGFAPGDDSAQREPSYVAVGYPAPKEPPIPGFASGDGGAQRAAQSDLTLGSPPSKETPQPGFAPGGDGAASDVALGYPPAKEPPQPGFAPGGDGAAADVALGYPPAKEPPVPGVAAQGATAQALVDRVRAARWQVWNQQAAALPDGYVLSVELLRSRPGEAFAVVTRVSNHRAVRSVVGAPAAMTATDDPASPDMIALGSPPPIQPADPGVVAQGLSLLSTAFAGDAAPASTPGR